MSIQSSANDTEPRRRWLQFSLRTMMVLVVICLVPCGWLGMKVKQAREQRAAAKVFEELGADAEYGQASEGIAVSLGKLLGEDLSVNTTGVQLADTSITDAGLEHLRGLTQLQSLSLDRTASSSARTCSAACWRRTSPTTTTSGTTRASTISKS